MVAAARPLTGTPVPVLAMMSSRPPGEGTALLVLDVLWRKPDRHGADLMLLLKEKGIWTTVKIAAVSWHPQYSDGWRRYAWDVPPNRKDRPIAVTVFGGPEVSIEPARLGDTPYRVAIVRLPRADYVPQPGEPARLGDLAPLDLTVFASTVPMEDPFATAQLSNVTDYAHVRHLPDGIVATHGDGHWEVQVKVKPKEPAAFGFELSAAPAAGQHVLARSAYRMRVVCQGQVEVVYRQRTTRMQVRPGFGVHGDTSSVVDLDVADVTDSLPLPLSGLTLDRGGRYRTVSSVNQYPQWETTVTNVVLSMASGLPTLAGSLAGFTPVVVLGTLYGFGEVLYAMASGRDFAGTEVSTFDIVLMGTLALVGAVLDFAGEFADLAAPILKARIPEAELAAVESTLTTEVGEQLLARTSPMLAEAVRQVGPEDAARLAKALKTAAATSGAPDAMRLLGGELTTVLAPLLAKVNVIDGIPEPLYREVLPLAHIADTASYASLTVEQRVLAAQRYAAAIAKGDPRLLRLDEISRQLAEEFTELVRDAVTGRIFNAALDGFRITSMNDAVVGQGLGAGYEAYRAGKKAKGRSARNVMDWAFNQRPNSRYYPMLVAELGENFRELLRPLVHRMRYAVDQAAANIYRPVAGRIHSYQYLRSLLAGKNVGALMQVDHILEQRFANYFDALALLGELEFDSIVVPYNAIVAQGLKKFGITDLPYTHVHKTARLKHWIPYGSEGMFTVQEIYNAYCLVYRYELGMEDGMDEALKAIFTQFWNAVREEAEDAIAEGIDISTDIRLADVMKSSGLSTAKLDDAVEDANWLRESVIAARARFHGK